MSRVQIPLSANHKNFLMIKDQFIFIGLSVSTRVSPLFPFIVASPFFKGEVFFVLGCNLSSDSTKQGEGIPTPTPANPPEKEVVPAINSNISSADAVLKAAVKADHARKS